MRLDDGDQLIAARMAKNESNVLLVSSDGQAIRFKIDDLRDASRTSGGVRGMKLTKGGYVVGVETIDDGDQLLIISERGFGKRTPITDYRLTGRGGQGVKTLNITDRTGDVAACRIVAPGQELMLVSKDGIVIRTSVNSISLLGRVTQGVTIMRVGEGDQVSSIAAFTMDDAPARPLGRPAEPVVIPSGQSRGARMTPLNGAQAALGLDVGDDEEDGEEGDEEE
jgi:DNA gyrase subunit A